MRLRSIALRTKENEIASAPKTIKLYINRPAIGFEDVQDSEAEQTFELSEEDVKSGKQIQLRYVRFQNVNSLHVSDAMFTCSSDSFWGFSASSICLVELDFRG